MLFLIIEVPISLVPRKSDRDYAGNLTIDNEEVHTEFIHYDLDREEFIFKVGNLDKFIRKGYLYKKNNVYRFCY